MLGQRRRRCANIETALGECPVFAGKQAHTAGIDHEPLLHANTVRFLWYTKAESLFLSPGTNNTFFLFTVDKAWVSGKLLNRCQAKLISQ